MEKSTEMTKKVKIKKKLVKKIKKKKIIGRTEIVEIQGKEYPAKIDTGAWTGCIDEELAYDLDLGSPIKTKEFYTIHGESKRAVVEVEIKIKGRKVRGRFSIDNREGRKYPILIGRNMLNKGFLVNVRRKCVLE